jgi:hypothetical protein
MKFKSAMSAEDQAKVISTQGTKTYKFGAGESVRSLRKVGFHAYVAGNRVNFLVDIIPEDDERERIHHRLQEGHREPQGEERHGHSTSEGG